MAFHDLQVWNLWGFSTIKVITFHTLNILITKPWEGAMTSIAWHPGTPRACLLGVGIPWSWSSPVALFWDGVGRKSQMFRFISRPVLTVQTHVPGRVLSDTGFEQGKQSFSSAQHNHVFKVLYRLKSSGDLYKAVRLHRWNSVVLVNGESKGQRGKSTQSMAAKDIQPSWFLARSFA